MFVSGGNGIHLMNYSIYNTAYIAGGIIGAIAFSLLANFIVLKILRSIFSPVKMIMVTQIIILCLRYFAEFSNSEIGEIRVDWIRDFLSIFLSSIISLFLEKSRHQMSQVGK